VGKVFNSICCGVFSLPKSNHIYFLIAAFLLLEGFFGSYLQCASISSTTIACTGIMAVLTRNYELANNTIQPPYLSQPLEYPFVSGFIFWAIDLLASTFKDPVLGMFLFTPVITSLASVLSIFVFWKLQVPWQKTLFWFALSPVVLMTSEFELYEIAFFLVGYLLFTKKKYTQSAILFGLSSGVKYFPLLTLPIFAKEAPRKAVFALVWLCTFLSGMLIEFLLGPLNFFRTASFYSSYGIEGSWLGLVFGHIINYTTETTWYIGTNASISLPQPYQIASILLVLASCFFIWRSRFSMMGKSLLVFAAIYIFLWISAPQFFILIAGLLPLVEFGWKRLPFVYFIGILDFFPFVIFVASHAAYVAAYYLQVMSELLLSVIAVWWLLEKYQERML
jgi:hypothetical protein